MSRIAAGAFLFSVSLSAQWITGFYAAQNGVEPVSGIPWTKYTHIVHFAAAPGVDGNGNGNGTVDLHYLSQGEIRLLISSRPAGKMVLVCIADNGSYPHAFAQSTASATIGAFVGNIAGFVSSNGYDGVDLDWESNVNTAQYSQLFAQLRAAMPDKIITTDMGNFSNLQQVAAASQSNIDQINIECYDMDLGSPFPWFNSALFQNGNPTLATCDWRVAAFTNLGVAPAKLGVGLPFYGRRWEGITRSQTTTNASMTSSTVLYNRLVTDTTRWQPQYQFYDPLHHANYLSIAPLDEFISYVGAEELQDAVTWMKLRQFGGVMTYSLYYEYLAGETGDAQYPLSTVLFGAMSDPLSPSAGSSIPGLTPSPLRIDR
jgi:chitinase